MDKKGKVHEKKKRALPAHLLRGTLETLTGTDSSLTRPEVDDYIKQLQPEECVPGMQFHGGHGRFSSGSLTRPELDEYIKRHGNKSNSVMDALQYGTLAMKVKHCFSKLSGGRGLENPPNSGIFLNHPILNDAASKTHPNSNKRQLYSGLIIVIKFRHNLFPTECPDVNEALAKIWLGCLQRHAVGATRAQWDVEDTSGMDPFPLIGEAAKKAVEKRIRSCYTCGKTKVGLLACGGCKSVRFCDAICQSKGRKEGGAYPGCIAHKLECEYTKN